MSNCFFNLAQIVSCGRSAVLYLLRRLVLIGWPILCFMAQSVGVYLFCCLIMLAGKMRWLCGKREGGVEGWSVGGTEGSGWVERSEECGFWRLKDVVWGWKNERWGGQERQKTESQNVMECTVKLLDHFECETKQNLRSPLSVPTGKCYARHWHNLFIWKHESILEKT